MSNIIYGPLENGFLSVMDYLAKHVVTCLIPAFFIAGAIAVFVKKDAILKYFGPTVKKRISYPIAAVSGTVLAVCSCTILPLFAGIYRKGSGLGPATAFLYSGPAINILAIVYTAQVLGYDLGIARAVSAILLSVVIGVAMAALFKDKERKEVQKVMTVVQSEGGERPWKVTLAFFAVLVGILVFGAAKIPLIHKLVIVGGLLTALLVILKLHFGRDDMEDWGYETWDLTKKILPLLLAGTFVVGVIAYFLPPETFRPYLGGESIGATFLGAVIGAILYMPTLLEVPIIGTTFGYTDGVMGSGPALALLLAGPAVSLPNMVVLQRIIGTKRTLAYVGLVIAASTIAGYVYGMIST